MRGLTQELLMIGGDRDLHPLNVTQNKTTIPRKRMVEAIQLLHHVAHHLLCIPVGCSKSMIGLVGLHHGILTTAVNHIVPNLRNPDVRLLRHLGTANTPKTETMLLQMTEYRLLASHTVPMINQHHELHRRGQQAIVQPLLRWLLQQDRQQQLCLSQHTQEHLLSHHPDPVPLQDLHVATSARLAAGAAFVAILADEEVLVDRHFAAEEAVRLLVLATAAEEQHH